MSVDIQACVIEKMKQHNKFCLQIDESVDVAGIPQLMVYVKYIFDDGIQEEFLFCYHLQTTTMGEDIFRVVDTHFKDKL